MDAALSWYPPMSLRNMNIAPRAFTGFALIGGLMLILGVFALMTWFVWGDFFMQLIK